MAVPVSAETAIVLAVVRLASPGCSPTMRRLRTLPPAASGFRSPSRRSPNCDTSACIVCTSKTEPLLPRGSVEHSPSKQCVSEPAREDWRPSDAALGGPPLVWQLCSKAQNHPAPTAKWSSLSFLLAFADGGRPALQSAASW